MSFTAQRLRRGVQTSEHCFRSVWDILRHGVKLSNPKETHEVFKDPNLQQKEKYYRMLRGKAMHPLLEDVSEDAEIPSINVRSLPL